MTAFANWYVNLGWSTALVIWLMSFLVIGAVCWFCLSFLGSLEDRHAEREMRREWKAIRKRDRKEAKLREKLFITNKQLAKHRQDINPRVSRGFIFAMRDMKDRK